LSGRKYIICVAHTQTEQLQEAGLSYATASASTAASVVSPLPPAPALEIREVGLRKAGLFCVNPSDLQRHANFVSVSSTWCHLFNLRSGTSLTFPFFHNQVSQT